MPSRWYLPSAGTPSVSPTFSADWEHQNTVRRPMSLTKGASTLGATAYTPDAADHLVDQDALVVQFVSETLAAQTIAAQTVTLTAQSLEANAGNNLFMTWKLFVWTAAGAVGSTILAIRRDPTNEVGTASTNRTDAATTTAVTLGDGDRIVLELGLGGLPVAAGGVQGHNGTYRLGESGLTDAPANDTSTSTTENPWLEFANVITPLVPPPATTATIAASVDARAAIPAVRGGVQAVSLRAGLAVAVLAVPRARRAVVTWAALWVPVPAVLATAAAVSAQVRGALRTVVGARARSATMALRLAARTTSVAGVRTTAGVARVAVAARVQARISSRAALDLRAAVRSASVAVHTSQASIAVRTQSRAELAAVRGTAALATASTLAHITTVPSSERAVLVEMSATGLIGTPLASMGAQGVAALLAQAKLSLTAVSGYQAPVRLAGRVNLSQIIWESELSPTIPFAIWDPINLGAVYRGDTIVMPIWQAKDGVGNVIDLTDSTLWFTAKTDLEEADTETPTIQCSTEDGGIIVLDQQSGFYQVTLQPIETQQLDGDTAFTFDVQVQTNGTIRTIRWGGLVVVRDITRATG